MVPGRCITLFYSIDMRASSWTAIGKVMGWNFIKMGVGIKVNLREIFEMERAN